MIVRVKWMERKWDKVEKIFFISLKTPSNSNVGS